MALSRAEVEHVATLARLDLSESEKETFANQLGAILSYVEQLRGLDTSGVSPTATVLGATKAAREDVVTPSLPVERAVANAPEPAEGFFGVPKIINESK
jgi:aspartyl-tRNA(Asn)/glutamyl-tRNA(Gln) amidotransferase subunit C